MKLQKTIIKNFLLPKLAAVQNIVLDSIIFSFIFYHTWY